MEYPQELKKGTDRTGTNIRVNESNSDKSTINGRLHATSALARRIIRSLALASSFRAIISVCRRQPQRLVSTLRSYRAQTPLHEQLLIGFVFTVFGIVVLMYSLVAYLIHGQVVPGFTFLASIIAIFSGVQLFSLGIIGEYIGRIFISMNKHPQFTIRESC